MGWGRAKSAAISVALSLSGVTSFFQRRPRASYRSPASWGAIASLKMFSVKRSVLPLSLTESSSLRLACFLRRQGPSDAILGTARVRKGREAVAWTRGLY